jgi:hypothetical protein
MGVSQLKVVVQGTERGLCEAAEEEGLKGMTVAVRGKLVCLATGTDGGIWKQWKAEFIFLEKFSLKITLQWNKNHNNNTLNISLFMF